MAIMHGPTTIAQKQNINRTSTMAKPPAAFIDSPP